MHMLPEGTTTMGFGLFRAIVKPYQKPRNMRTIRLRIVTIWMYSFFQSLLRVAVNAFASVCPVGCCCALRVLCFKSYRLEREKMRESEGYREFVCLRLLCFTDVCGCLA